MAGKWMGYLLVRRNPDGQLEGIRFDHGIVAAMRITDGEWKAIDLDRDMPEAVER